MLAIFLPNMLVNLLLTGYSGVTQFFPMIVFGLFWKSSTKIASFAGLIVGEFLVFYLMLSKLDPLAVGGLHFNAGFVALVVNTAVFLWLAWLPEHRPASNGKSAPLKAWNLLRRRQPH